MWQVHSSRGRLRRVAPRRIHSVQHHLISRCRSVFDTCDSFHGSRRALYKLRVSTLALCCRQGEEKRCKDNKPSYHRDSFSNCFLKSHLSNYWSHIRITGQVPHPGCVHLMDESCYLRPVSGISIKMYSMLPLLCVRHFLGFQLE